MGRWGADIGRGLRRYWPFLAIVGLQLALLAAAPTTQSGSVALRSTTGSAGLSGTEADAGSGATSSAVAGSANGVSGGAGSGGSSSGQVASRSSSAGAPAGASAGASPAEGAPGATVAQRVDSLGRPVDGDRSRCASGGVVQESVTALPMPCIPKFAGDNGGATYQGVTKDTITVVLYVPSYGPTVDAALHDAGLFPSPQEWHDAFQSFLTFVNNHYELYGRHFVGQEYTTACTDAACSRADAKALVAKYHPFAVIGADESGSTIPEPTVDQLAQLGVVTRGAPSLSDAWFAEHAPYAWGVQPQGARVADMLADYYCKKMWGKNATLAGDPTMQIQRRKLGVLTTDDAATLDVWRRFKTQVTGGMCGSAGDGTTLYTLPADQSQAQTQGPALMTRLKNDGITTVAGLTPLGQEADKQQYYPENLSASQVWGDTDNTGRLENALNSPTQMSHTFGIGWWPAAQPVQDMDYYKAMQEAAPGSNPPFAVEFAWKGVSLIARLVQWAGPHLTPQTIEAGAHGSPQLGGWVNPTPWAGWKCCNPYEPEWKLGSSPSSYSAVTDAREIYWDSKAISKQDNTLGAWVCVNDCKRYEVGQWPQGDPEK